MEQIHREEATILRLKEIVTKQMASTSRKQGCSEAVTRAAAELVASFIQEVVKEMPKLLMMTSSLFYCASVLL